VHGRGLEHFDKEAPRGCPARALHERILGKVLPVVEAQGLRAEGGPVSKRNQHAYDDPQDRQPGTAAPRGLRRGRTGGAMVFLFRGFAFHAAHCIGPSRQARSGAF